MKRARFIVATSAVLALAAGAARADTMTYSYTGYVQYYPVETTGTYSLIVAGAQGGSGAYTTGGGGTVLTGDYVLSAGTVLDIVVGAWGKRRCRMATRPAGAAAARSSTSRTRPIR